MSASVMNKPQDNAMGPPANSAPQTQTQLPSIDLMTSGVPAQGVSGQGDSPNYTFFDPARDSGVWSMQSQSKHASMLSTSTNGVQLPPLNNARTSPNRNSYGQSDRSPFSPTFPHTPVTNGNQPSPVHGFNFGTTDPNMPQLNKSYDGPAHYRGSGEFPPPDSRRSSIDSNMKNGMGQLALGASSPYQSQNASQTSIVNNLQRERGIPSSVENARGLRLSASSSLQQQPLSPLGRSRVGAGNFNAGRVAPPIMPTTRQAWPNPNAKNPTPGAPYAFPDPELAAPGTMSRMSSSGDDEDRGQRDPYSRRNSAADSIGSSIFTSDSRLPPGQRRLDDDLPGVHHHQLQHRQVSGLMGEDQGEGANGTSPYSRTPELRVSHKMAERKRRSEMKDLFEELSRQLPSHRGAKSSKWEILTKAIEHVKSLECHQERYKGDAHQLRAVHDENQALRDQNNRLNEEVHELRLRLQHQSSQQVQPQNQQPYTYSHFNTPPLPSLSNDRSRTVLPPMNATAPLPRSSSMQGIQYSSH
ncbi:MAG: hypothetical protein M1827_007061 [Pycnora praestabilis]|nr:MAG: hypothetical protein M1827_007061 [Pycnora praestabilis]